MNLGMPMIRIVFTSGELNERGGLACSDCLCRDATISNLKKRLGIGWLVVFGAHMGLAAIALYVINYSGWITQVYIPINPVTMGAVTILGLPGIVLLLGLKIVLFGQAI